MCEHCVVSGMTFPVRSYVTDISRPGSFYDKWFYKMPRSRQEKCERFRFKDDKKRCIISYALLVNALHELAEDLGTDKTWQLTEGFPAISADANGKPAFSDIPVFFNISHSGERVMVCLSPGETGCDVEHKSNGALKIAKRFFAPAEYEYLLQISDESEQSGEFTRIWTLKESVVKCCGEGIRHEFSDFSVIDDGCAVKSIKLDGGDGLYHMKEYDAENGYCYSCCSIYDDFEPGIRNIKFT
ncbi:MAG: 4'-phosphopantetheinyl transferase superfamily protein [Lachnospiraceae bacterium]|nr:4'-phosphopantetheinyl transferase superfamily protein [Lachnospiraceae bacterium]